MNIEERKWEIMFDENAIDSKLTELGNMIKNDYKDKNLLIIALLKGSFIFCADLVRKIDIKTLRVNFMTTSSYGHEEVSSGRVKVQSDITISDITDYDVLIVDDIADTANTMNFVLNHIKAKNPKSLKTCVLLDKPSRREVEFKPDYCGYTIEDKFVVGYGFDFHDKYRNVPYIFNVTNELR
ncbi:hypoxanthine phosphoribosyltransferase [Peptostreptococcus canis]|uniref:Hypoxanthine phosphoribosyltransferase n=1 Tax=Peptostreptococcus canis TaxID=1159213 RepID=A0ABR6TJ49_9FIRM|nr:hypoxanthine phosphoribosyltransferase [Peptostreptococcus canis]MBC2575419.1 hypoxanthine phosphoribosyltransferase [Peptostreptococcus canis]MBP1997392.1 hypoxanthine phosphoribosyltransferase [Peptostreptococcus canis]